MNNITKTQLNEVYTLWVSGCAKMKNDKEIWFKGKTGWMIDDGDITAEFPTLSFSYAIIRRYYESGNLHYFQEYKNGRLDGKHIVYRKNGNIHRVIEYQKGFKHGKDITYYKSGCIYRTVEYQSGKFIKFIDYQSK